MLFRHRDMVLRFGLLAFGMAIPNASGQTSPLAPEAPAGPPSPARDPDPVPRATPPETSSKANSGGGSQVPSSDNPPPTGVANGAGPPPTAAPIGSAQLTPPAAGPLVATDGAPLAGFYSGLFYVRDATDRFRFYPRARGQLDVYVPFGVGVSDLPSWYGEEPTAFIRRAQLDLAGEVLDHWQWTVAGDFGQSATDNANGQSTTAVSTVDPNTGIVTSVPRAAPVQSIGQTARPTDVFVNYKVDRPFNVMLGQFKIPLTLENRSNDFTNNFMEAPLAVKNLAAHTAQRDLGLMVWGESRDALVNYSVGLFNGDGPNRYNVDASGDAIGRIFFHPLVATGVDAVSKLQIGGSFRYGRRSSKDVGYDLPAFSTQGRYAFFKPTYVDSAKNLIHIIPSGSQGTYVGELYWPVGPLDFTTEFMYVAWQTREARDFYQLTPFAERHGDLHGSTYYVTVALWLSGDRKFVRKPGYTEPPHIDFSKPSAPTEPSLQAVVRFEQFNLVYDGAARNNSVADPRTPNGHIKVTGLGLALNYFASRHVTATINYDYYFFPDSAPLTPTAAGGPTQTSAQRALAPAQNLPIGVNDRARDTAHDLHELSFRLSSFF